MAYGSKKLKQIDIRCPECRQNFQADESLMGRRVECGNCEAQFRIEGDVIARAKKVYPGERNAPMLDRFRRVPHAVAQGAPGMQPANYQDFNDPARIGPTPPQRIIAGIVGVGMIVLTALLLIFGSEPGEIFYATTLLNKLIMAGFVAIIGTILLLYANPKSRGKASFTAILLSAGLCAIPFFFGGGPLAAAQDRDFIAEETEPDMEEEEEADPVLNLREKFGTTPLEKEQDRLANEESEKNAFGIYLTNILPKNVYTATDYMIRETEADLSSHRFPRDDGHYLLVLSQVPLPFDQVITIASKLGRIESTHPEIGVISIMVDNEQFIAASTEKLNDANHPAFYELNKRELQSIDSGRVESAVVRLTGVEPTIFRSDISKILIDRLEKPGINFEEKIAKALLVWANDIEKASAAALSVVKRSIIAGTTPSEEVIKLAVLTPTIEAVEPIATLWKKTPNLWEKYLVQLGPATTPSAVEALSSGDTPLQRSAIKLLGKVGTADSVAALQPFLESKDPEIRMLTQKAISAIEER